MKSGRRRSGVRHALLTGLLLALLPVAPTPRTQAQDGASLVGKALSASDYLAPAPALRRPADLLSWSTPEQTLLLVYSGGSEEERLPDPCGVDRRTTPAFLSDLAGDSLAPGGPRVAVLVYCTPFILGGFDQTRGQGEPKVARRAQALVALLDRLGRDGLPGRRIFLVGQSAGAWASLEAAAARPGQLAGVIALAPAFAGPKDSRDASWQRLFETRRAALAQAEDLQALIFTFTDDRFGAAEDLDPLAALPGVTLLNLPSRRIGARDCRGYHPHRTAFYDCFRRSQLTRIKDFMVQAGQKY